MTAPLLQLNNLKTSFKINDEFHAAVDNLTMTINKNEVLAIVGESGCGKSALAFSIMQLHTKAKVEGEINYEGENLIGASAAKLNNLRGNEIGMIFQDSLSALNPLIVVGEQIGEIIYLHNKKGSKTERKNLVLELLDKVGIPNVEKVYNQYPHELSGGMRQRVVIAMAIANKPQLLIADEPTTALDVTIQAQILELLRELKEDMNAGIIIITHDLGVVAEMADRVAVMYAGQIVELADVYTIMENAKHPYTRSLLNSMPSADQIKDKLHVIQGVVPPLNKIVRTGCRFQDRIPWVDASAHEENPQLREVAPGHFVRCTCHQHFEFPEENKRFA